MRNSYRILLPVIALCLFAALPSAVTGQNAPTPTTTAKKAVANKKAVNKKAESSRKGPTVEERLQKVTEQIQQ